MEMILKSYFLPISNVCFIFCSVPNSEIWDNPWIFLSSLIKAPKGLNFVTVPLIIWPVWYLFLTFSQGFPFKTLVERDILSSSISTIFAFILSPTLKNSAGLSIICQSISDIWIRPSKSLNFTKTPNSTIPVTVPSTTSPTLCFSKAFFIFFSSAAFSETINFFSLISRSIIFNLIVLLTNLFNSWRIFCLSPPSTRG